MYHIGRNMWSKMENRTVKNVSAPAVVMDEKIYIIGGKRAKTDGINMNCTCDNDNCVISPGAWTELSYTVH